MTSEQIDNTLESVSSATYYLNIVQEHVDEVFAHLHNDDSENAIYFLEELKRVLQTIDTNLRK